MTGTLRWRDDRQAWKAQVYVGTDRDGKRRFLTRTIRQPNNRTGRRAAERALAELVVEADVRADEILNPPPLEVGSTVGDLLDEWWHARRQAWSPTSTQTARVNIDRYLTPHLGTIRVDRLTARQVEDCYRTLMRSGGRNGRPLAASTVARVHTTLSSAYSQAERWDLVDRSPMRQVAPPRVTRTTIRPPTRPELAAALNATVKRPGLRLFLLAAAHTGARRGELCGLQWADIGPDTVTIRRSVAFANRTVTIKHTKTDRVRTVAIDPPLADAFRRWRLDRDELALRAGHRIKPSAWVFSHSLDQQTPPRPDWATRAWARLRTDLDLGHIRLHDLRHWTATTALAAGVDVGTVADRLGHSRASTTLDIYRHHVPANDRTASDILGEHLA